VVGIVIGCVAGVAVLFVAAVCLYKCIFRDGKGRKRSTLDDTVEIDDPSGSSAAQERREALILIRDLQHS
jgi:hypothetical protein